METNLSHHIPDMHLSHLNHITQIIIFHTSSNSMIFFSSSSHTGDLGVMFYDGI